MKPDYNDAEELRRKLLDYYGTAMTNGNPMAAADLVRIETMDPEEIIEEAEKNHIH